MQSLHDQWLETKARLAAEDAARVAAAPAPRALDLDPDFDVATALESQLEPSRRADGWTAARQHGFLTLVATGHSIEAAARAQGLSASSAYSFRNSAKGAAFAVGWLAAQMLQRQRLADTVSARAFEGQTVTVTRPDGSTVERHFHDNRLAMNVLARLDRIAAGQLVPGAADTGETQAARLAAAEFDRYLDILGEGPARAGLFLAARTVDAAPGAPELAAISTLARADLYTRTGAGVMAEVDVTDLDPAQRVAWSAEQWARAEAAGLLVIAPVPEAGEDEGGTQHSQHSPEADEDDPVWWCDLADAWRTSFPPPEDFDGEEEGRYGDPDYARALSWEEELDADLPEHGDTEEDAETRAAHAAERDRWFAAARAKADAALDRKYALAPDADSAPAPEERAATAEDAPAVSDQHSGPAGAGADWLAQPFAQPLAVPEPEAADAAARAVELAGDAPRSPVQAMIQRM
ncbi:hypothetical protein [Sphingomonas sp.]|uniref:hypothetical protein n=1 Tax=Sphingomonas sp. TaxID=28214 RepID=UPI002D7F8425|nr:hypothetical protein [Sphingomonas sp.]HEU0045875.1 hypothetical protein [Sphingomonas sp.]